MATKLSIYNGALALLGETPLSSLSEDRAARYWLDKAWDNGLIDYCLEQGQWYFATRSQKITQSTTIIPAYGYKYAFEIPDDFIGVIAVWLDSFFKVPLEDYQIQSGVIYSAFDTIYLQFISNSSTYGGNLARFPKSFEKYVQAEFALLAEPSITNSLSVNARIEREVIKRKRTAKNSDKRDKPEDVLPLSRWTKSRIGYGGGFYGSGFCRDGF